MMAKREAVIKIFFAFSIVVHLAFLVSLKTGFLNFLFVDTAYRIGQGADFFQFYQSGSDLIHGRSIYQDLSHVVVPHVYWNRYPPFASYTLGLITNLFSPWTAYLLWVTFLEGSFLCCLYLLRRLCPDRPTWLLCAAVWLCFTPYYVELYMGQTNFFIGLCIFLMVLSYNRGRKTLFSLLYLVSVCLKMLTWLFTPMLWRMKRYALCALAVVLPALFSASYFIFFKEDTIYWLRWVFGSSMDEVYHAGNLGLRAFLFDLWPSYPFVMVISGYIVLMSTVLTFRARQIDLVEGLLLWLCTYFLAFKFVWEHQYVMMLPLLTLFYIQRPSPFLIGVYVLLAMPTPMALFDRKIPGVDFLDPQQFFTLYQSLIHHSSKVIPVTALYVYLARTLIKSTAKEKALTEEGRVEELRVSPILLR